MRTVNGLIDLLHDNPMSVAQIARIMRQSPGNVARDLEHLLLSLKHTEYSAAILPAICRQCGFEFVEHKLRRPSRCPACHSHCLTEPRVSLERKG
jgi:predicted Zn-ribbon and HTH transcriptional regulator